MTSVATPTTQALSDSIISELEGSLSTTFPLLPKAFVRVLAKVLAGVVVLVYKYAGWSYLQRFARYASFRETTVLGIVVRPLVELARRIGFRDPDPGARAELTVDVTVLNQTGELPAFSQLVRVETGVIYLTAAPVPLDAATVQASVVAQSDPDGNAGIGAIGNLSAGDELEFANTPPNVEQVATVVSLDVVGADAESEDDYRNAVLGFEAARPQGGAHADYRTWGESVSGVKAIYPYASNDRPGEVDVYVEADSAIESDGIAPDTLLDSVKAAIELNQSGLAENRPVSAAVNALTIIRSGFGLVISGFQPNGVTGIEALIEAGVDDYLRSREPFILGLSRFPRLDRVTQGALAGVVHDIVSAEGATVSSVSLTLGGNTISGYTLKPGEKAKLATNGITYQ